MAKIEYSLPWLTDDSGRLLGYYDDQNRARKLDGTLIDPGPDPALPSLGGGAFATITGTPADNVALAAELATKTDKGILYDIVSTTTYTLLETDLGRNLVFTNAAGCLVSVTDALSASWASGLLRQGSSAGQIVLQATGTHTLTSVLGSTPADLTSTGAYSLCSVHRTSATSFIMTGELGTDFLGTKSVSAAYTFALGDELVLHPSTDVTARTFTIPANATVAFPIGTTITVDNGSAAGVVTIAITTDTLRQAGTANVGSRTLAANGLATLLKTSATTWKISGMGLT